MTWPASYTLCVRDEGHVPDIDSRPCRECMATCGISHNFVQCLYVAGIRAARHLFSQQVRIAGIVFEEHSIEGRVDAEIQSTVPVLAEIKRLFITHGDKAIHQLDDHCFKANIKLTRTLRPGGMRAAACALVASIALPHSWAACMFSVKSCRPSWNGSGFNALTEPRSTRLAHVKTRRFGTFIEDQQFGSW